MSEVTPPPPRTATVELMRWSDHSPGIECFERDITWIRQTKAKSVLLNNGNPVAKGGSLYASKPFMQDVHEAVAVCAEATRWSGVHPKGPYPQFIWSVVAETVDMPYVRDPSGKLSPVPEDWFFADKKSLDQWLLACDRDERIEAPAKQVAPVTIVKAEVWRGDKTESANRHSLERFERVSSRPDAEPEVRAKGKRKAAVVQEQEEVEAAPVGLGR